MSSLAIQSRTTSERLARTTAKERGRGEGTPGPKGRRHAPDVRFTRESWRRRLWAERGWAPIPSVPQLWLGLWGLLGEEGPHPSGPRTAGHAEPTLRQARAAQSSTRQVLGQTTQRFRASVFSSVNEMLPSKCEGVYSQQNTLQIYTFSDRGVVTGPGASRPAPAL